MRKRPNTGRTTARASVERRHRVGSFIRHVRRGSAHLLLAENYGTKGGALFRELVQSSDGQTQQQGFFPVDTLRETLHSPKRNAREQEQSRRSQQSSS